MNDQSGRLRQEGGPARRLLTIAAAFAAVAILAVVSEWRTPTLGPLDGQDLPPLDLDRVGVGEEAPDFRLKSFAGEPVRLSDFRGEQDVVLVFYRGHW